ncbi:MAG: outer membrane beta-barrel protein [Deltaproteobacteria bacterium]|nr:outer membrane beta-barrel protein [Deltaproteobacteria bacterium]
MEVGWKNRSNIFLSEDNEVSDNIFEIKPAIALHHDFTETSFWAIEYQGTFALYQDNTDNDWSSHYVPFDFFLGGKTGPFVEVSNDFWRSDDPYGSQDLYNLGIKTKRTQNETYVSPGWTFSPKTKAQVYARYIYLEYNEDQDKFQNQREWNYGGKFFYKFWPKTSALFQYQYATREYSDQPDSTAEDFYRNDVYVGLVWDATGKLTGEAKVGYSFMDYDNEFNTVGQKYENYDTWIAQVNLTWQATSRIVLTGWVERAIRQSTQSLVGDEFPNNYYVDTNARLGARYSILHNLTAFAMVLVGLNEYNSLDGTDAREDDVFKGQIGLEYSFLRYLYLTGQYLYDYRDSNKDGLGYTDNVFYVGLGGRF